MCGTPQFSVLRRPIPAGTKQVHYPSNVRQGWCTWRVATGGPGRHQSPEHPPLHSCKSHPGWYGYKRDLQGVLPDRTREDSLAGCPHQAWNLKLSMFVYIIVSLSVLLFFVYQKYYSSLNVHEMCFHFVINTILS